ncbi:MAG: hypothetical protein HeimC3_15420 [Candidatus Heimdallarchaeota archaeon LC_3]|nr:MAG: hypothetical protein HeimC3_15420 [Candidatus Heimdallarchaeota archaeon LC_3]
MKLVDHKDLEFAYQQGNYREILDSIETIGYTNENSDYFYYYIGSSIELGKLNKVEFLLNQYEPRSITPENVIIWHLLKGKYYNALNEFNLAITELELALKFCPKKKKSIIRAEINIQLAYALRGIKKYYLAIDIAQQAYFGMITINHIPTMAQTYNILGLLHIDIKDFNKARNYLKEALLHFEEINNKHYKAITLFYLSLLFQKQNQYQEAVYLGERAFDLFQKSENMYNIVCSSISLGEIYFSLNQPLRAGQHLKNAQILAEKIGNYPYVAQALMYLGKVVKNQRKYKESLQYLHKALTLLELNDEPEILAKTLYNLGIIFSIQNNYEEALQVFNRSLRLRERIGDQESIARTLLKISDVKFHSGMKNEALQILTDIRIILAPSKNIRLKLINLFQNCKFRYLMNILDSNFLLIDDNLKLDDPNNAEIISKYQIALKGMYNIHLNNKYDAEFLLKECLNFNNFDLDAFNFINKLLTKMYLENWNSSESTNDFQKLIEHLDIWEEFCKKENLGDTLVILCLIRGRISIIRNNLKDAERRLVQCSITSEEMGLPILKNEIDEELTFLIENREIIGNQINSSYYKLCVQKINHLLSY